MLLYEEAGDEGRLLHWQRLHLICCTQPLDWFA